MAAVQRTLAHIELDTAHSSPISVHPPEAAPLLHTLLPNLTILVDRRVAQLAGRLLQWRMLSFVTGSSLLLLLSLVYGVLVEWNTVRIQRQYLWTGVSCILAFWVLLPGWILPRLLMRRFRRQLQRDLEKEEPQASSKGQFLEVLQVQAIETEKKKKKAPPQQYRVVVWKRLLCCSFLSQFVQNPSSMKVHIRVEIAHQDDADEQELPSTPPRGGGIVYSHSPPRSDERIARVLGVLVNS